LFFFQAEDGRRDRNVTGVQTCALPICKIPKPDVKVVESGRDDEVIFMFDAYGLSLEQFNAYVEECKGLGYTVEPGSFEGFYSARSEERRVGNECIPGGSPVLCTNRDRV